MAKLFIVDGYNVIFNWPELKSISEESMEDAREGLVGVLNQLARFTGDEVRVVFDGHRVKKGKTSRQKQGEITVIFTRYGMTADELIEKMIIKESDLQIYVVTADETEQWITFGRGAYRMTPREMIAELAQNRAKMAEFYSEPLVTGGYIYQRIDAEIREILDRYRKGQ